MKKIVLTGGGTAGHVTPNIALLPELKKNGFEVHYIGSYDGIEKKLMEDIEIPYYGISSGKLRRYFDVKNFTDPFRVIKGYAEALTLIKKINPDIVFSKGGFVTVPVVKAAKRKNIPVILHESDISPGLANRMCISAATKICVNFPETIHHIPEEKAVLTGTPIRKELFTGNKLSGLDICGFTMNKPVLLVIGGSLGSAKLNQEIRDLLPTLLEYYQVIHLCGKGKLDENLKNTPGYMQFEYVQKELSDLLDAADLVISRAGANAICELLALRKPHILVPLSANASRGDQILNAASFEKQGFSYVIKEEDLTGFTLLSGIEKVIQEKRKYIETMSLSETQNSVVKIINLINEVVL